MHAPSRARSHTPVRSARQSHAGTPVRLTVAATRARPSHNARRCCCAAAPGGTPEPSASRRNVLLAPGLAALAIPLAASEQIALLPSPALAAGITPASVAASDFSTAISAAHVGPLGGAVGVTDYAKFEPVIYGFINGIKSGECPPWAKDATRGFLLKEVGGNRAMLTILIPVKDQKAGLPFFIDSGPKANPLWAESNGVWKDASVPVVATASEAFVVRGEAAAELSCKGKYIGQYQLGWNGKAEDWVPLFTGPDVNDFHNSVGVEFSVAHKMDLKTAGNGYKTKAKTGIEVFHCFNSLAGAQELAKVFTPDSPFFVNEPRYIGPYTQIIWECVDDITFKQA